MGEILGIWNTPVYTPVNLILIPEHVPVAMLLPMKMYHATGDRWGWYIFTGHNTATGTRWGMRIK